ncbi:MAG TPA: ATP-dependent helicase, partial [Nocardioides sp.]
RVEATAHEQLAVLRRELNGLVAAWNHRTSQPHGVTHAALRKECGGPPAAVATAEQLRARIDKIREWADQRRTS